MKSTDMNSDEKKVQKILNQLISEEWMASIMYKQFILATCCKDERHQIKDLLMELSEDEMDDHYAKLVKYAIHNGYSVPCQLKDYEEYASDKTVKQFNGWKKD